MVTLIPKSSTTYDGEYKVLPVFFTLYVLTGLATLRRDIARLPPDKLFCTGLRVPIPGLL